MRIILHHQLCRQVRQSLTCMKIVFLISWLLSLNSLPLVDMSPLEGDLVSPASSSSGPRIYITPQKLNFLIDTSTPATKVLTCQTAGDKPGMFSQLRWAGPNRSDNWDELAKKHRITEDIKNSNIWDLEFANPTVDDSGIYYCLGTYQSSDRLNASIYVEVHNPIKLENCYETQFIKEGSSNAKISCRITADSPTVTILKDGTPINRLNNRYMWGNEDGLVINGIVDQSDAGKYLIKVKASNTGEKRQQSIDVEVHSEPEVVPYNGTLPGKEFYGIEGQPATLQCRAKGKPKPLVQWRDPKLRNLTSVGGYLVDQEKGTLTIARVNKVDDNGVFQCFAENTVGKADASMTMIVSVPPKIVMFDNKTVDEGSEVTFECRSSGDPEPRFSIRRQGQNATPFAVGDGYVRDISTLPEGPGSTVYIHRLTVVAERSLFGQYFCNSTNQAGTAESSAFLKVNHAPDLSATPPEQYIRQGKKFSVTCHIMAYPEPTVSWWVDNTQLIDAQVNLKSDGHTHIVTMTPPDSQQLAFNRFTCRATNKVKTSQQDIFLRYITRPGLVSYELRQRYPTAVKLLLSVTHDGGDKIRRFKYRAEGKSLDFNNPLYSYRTDVHNDTYLDASPKPSEYMIRNLLPNFSYNIRIKAINDVDEGDYTEISVETAKPERPSRPNIIRPGTALPLTHSSSGVISDYQDAYIVRWTPPDSDNGDPIYKYIISYSRADIKDGEYQPIEVDQLSDRPLSARLGPLEPNQRYKIKVRARNNYGDSDESEIEVYTSPDRPSIPEYSVPLLAAILVAAIAMTIFIDLIFCFCFQMGLCHVVHKKGVTTLLC